MLTSAIITLAQSEFPDWSVEKIRTFLNELQRIVFTQTATTQMRMYDSTTGLDPVLTTVAGTYEYSIGTGEGFSYDAWRVYEVYATDIEDPEDVMTLDATPDSVSAKIIFSSDPGNNDYYVRCYRFPTPINSISTQLEIPHAYHITHLYVGLVGLIEQFRSGRSERWEKFEQKLLPELIKKLSEGKRNNTYFTPYRICGV